ncbi:HNH endonuclease [Paenarthrobacter aurescens]|uniref:HNH endonuclease n=1 Tax=Paenarthrobacter aurescens TaxID=43663 RepID=UPI0034D1AF00
MLRRNSHRCTYRGDRPSRLVMDHIIPLTKGGRHAPGSITPACANCNGAKGAMLLIVWKQRKKDGTD